MKNKKMIYRRKEFKHELELFFEHRILHKTPKIPVEESGAGAVDDNDEKPESPADKLAGGKKSPDRARRRLKTAMAGKVERVGFKKGEHLPAQIPGGSSTETVPGGTTEEAAEDEPVVDPDEATPESSTEESTAGKTDTVPEIKPKHPIKIPSKAPLSKEDFMARELRTEEIEFDTLRLNPTRENFQINWQNWDHSTVEGVDKIYNDCQDLKIINNDKVFYDSVFAILRNSVDGTKNSKWADTQYQNAFREPLNPENRELIAGLPASGDFPGGDAFLKAFAVLTYIKSIMLRQDSGQTGTAKKQREATENLIAGKITDFGRSTLSVVQKAVRERDWATLGAYAFGGYAIWETLGKKIFGGGGSHDGGDHGAGKDSFDFKKWLMIGTAAYCGNIFLKNAGYDLLKMAGFTNAHAELNDTPLANLSSVLESSQYSEQFKDLDSSIVLAMADQKLVTLEKLRLESNGKGINFIHPREFGKIFPDLKHVWPFKMGLGEEALRDTTGMYNTKLSPNEKEYIRVGQQIYKLALAMRETYDLTLHKHHKNYQSKGYDEVLTDTDLRQLKVRHLMDSIGEYVTPEGEKTLIGGKGRQEIEAKLNELASVVPGESFALDGLVEGASEGSGHYKGKFHGFPVVITVAPTGYRIYLRGDYGKKYNPNTGPGYVAEIPLNGGSGVQPAVERAVEKIRGKMIDLIDLSPIIIDKSKVKDTLQFVGGQWQCEVEDPAIPDLGINSSTKIFIPINPTENGDGIQGENLDASIRLPSQLLPKILGQDEFKTLKIFANADLLTLDKGAPNDGILTLYIGKSRLILDLKYMSSTKSFDYANISSPGQLIPLLRDPLFAQEYVAALEADENFELNKNINHLRELIQKSAPDGFVKQFFTSLFQENNKSAVSGINLDALSGTVPEYFTDMVLQTSKAEVFARLRRSILTANSLQEVEYFRNSIIADFNDRLLGISSIISEGNVNLERENKSWDRDIFIAKVIDPIRKAGSKSRSYTEMKMDFEFLLYKLPLPGFLTKRSDWSADSHNSASKLMGVYAYYTAHLDDGKLDYLKPWSQLPKSGNIFADADVQGYQKLRYFDYVKNTIFTKAMAFGDLSNVPAPEEQLKWGIQEFNEWLTTDGDYTPLDDLDRQDKFIHDPAVAHLPDPATGEIKYTALELAIIKEFDDTVAILIAEYPTELNFHAINSYLREAYDPSDASKSVGLFMLQVDPVSGNDVAQVWQWADTIAAFPRRSQQVKQIQGLANRFLIQHIFENPSTFFTSPISMKASILRRWPWLQDIPLVPNWINPLN